MKKFGEFLEEMLKNYEREISNNINNNIEIFFIKNWIHIIEKTENEKLKKCLQNSKFVSLQNEILTIKISDSNARFIFSLEEKNFIIFIKNQIKNQTQEEITINKIKIVSFM